MGTCEDGHPLLIYNDRQGQAACPVCWLDDALTRRLEDKDGEIAALHGQLRALETQLADALVGEGRVARRRRSLRILLAK